MEMFIKSGIVADVKLVALGKRIKYIRLLKGLSQSALAINCDMEKSSISKIEAGKVNITFLTLDRLSCCLNVEIKDLV